MIKLNLNAALKEVDEKSIPETTLGKVLSKRLAYANNEGNPIKMYDWATQLWSKGEIMVDRTDYDFLKNLVENDKELLVFAKAQLLLAMDKSFKESNLEEDK